MKVKNCRPFCVQKILKIEWFLSLKIQLNYKKSFWKEKLGYPSEHDLVAKVEKSWNADH
jgi:hypothetical protein